MSCQVKTTHGVLQGKECQTYYGKKYYSFEGIPYAKPPVGKLRFKAPLPPESWSGVRDATKPGNKCYQLNPYSKTSIEGSEDCLYLNVYTPSLPHEKIQKLPVFFFVHGGRLIFGYGNYYKPDYLLKHDVILVTINYRLHILGFLCLNTPEVPGNAGLKDSIMALKWVNKNIGFFNGDANNVTVSGESAGAGIASSFLTSKMADGLFHKVISQSGNAIADLYMVEEDPIEKARTVALNLGKDLTDVESLLDVLANAPMEDLIMAFTMAELGRPPSIVNAYFLPVVEKRFDNIEPFFTEYPRIDITLNRYKKVPILTGLNSHESALFLQRDDQGNIIYENDFFYFIPRYLHIKNGDGKVKDFERKFREFYLKNKVINDEVKKEYVDMISDRNFNYDIILLAELMAKSVDVFFYKFQYSGNLNTRVMKSLGLRGASHGDMMQYQFYRKNKHEKCTEKDIKLIEMLSEAWCNFAKNGNPTWSGQSTKWLPYTRSEKHTLLIDDEIKLVRNPGEENFKFWQHLTGEHSKL
ncbi:esterase FE4-like [Anticarsia gemmatalis]|uniref:esterase FE4-like n=1 Tax=Anticarsia gemmatalis TaxID=129554 RepID=UPI003F75FAE4